MIDWGTLETQLILEEIVKLPRTTDTSYVPPDVVELVEELLFDYKSTNYEKRP